MCCEDTEMNPQMQSEENRNSLYDLSENKPEMQAQPKGADLPGYQAMLSLEDPDMWKMFDDIGNEMIITKKGRRMFPSLRVGVYGLVPTEKYCILVEFVLACSGGACKGGKSCTEGRFKWTGSQWVAADGVAEPQSCRRVYLHPDSPATGDFWCSQIVQFNKLKITNNTQLESIATNDVVLTSMHKYVPHLYIVRCDNKKDIHWAPASIYVFPETKFMAVTIYQNQKITQLKIEYNPFAKGFRKANLAARSKRKQQDMQESTDSNLPSKDDKDEHIIVDDDPMEDADTGSSESDHSSPTHSDCNVGQVLPIEQMPRNEMNYHNAPPYAYYVALPSYNPYFQQPQIVPSYYFQQPAYYPPGTLINNPIPNPTHMWHMPQMIERYSMMPPTNEPASQTQSLTEENTTKTNRAVKDFSIEALLR